MRGARPEMTRSQESSPTAGAHRARSIIYVLLTIGVAAALWKISPARGPAGSRAVVASDRAQSSTCGTWGMKPACAATRISSLATASTRWAVRLLPSTNPPRSSVILRTTGIDSRPRDFEYSVERRDGRVFHRKTRRDQHGRVIAQADGEIRFTLGSGSRGLSFLIDRDGYLFQSPIAWYAQKAKWDLAPWTKNRTDQFERPINRECLFCHANRVEHVAGTENRYREPVFQGHAIGCERCHGPASATSRRASRRIKPSRTSSIPASLSLHYAKMSASSAT